MAGRPNCAGVPSPSAVADSARELAEEVTESETVKVEPDIKWLTVLTPESDNVNEDDYIFQPSPPLTVMADPCDIAALPLNGRQRRKANKKKLICPECGVQMESSDAQNHRQEHRRVHPYLCTECFSSFSERTDLARHRLYQHYEAKQPFPCGDCKAVLWSAAAYRHHRKKLHSKGQREVLAPPFRCKYCGDRFATDEQRAAHVVDHGSSPFACPVCGLPINSTAELTSHLLLHPDVPRPFHCLDCGQDFATNAGLAAHARKHNGPLTCAECGALHLTVAGLERHMEEHGACVPLDRFVQLVTLATDAAVLVAASGSG